jgi:hypothetical protein
MVTRATGAIDDEGVAGRITASAEVALAEVAGPPSSA